MSALDESLVGDVRALLAAFASEDMARLVAQLRPGVAVRLSRQIDAVGGVAVTAPHVGSLLDVRAEGTRIAAGESVATLDLLGEIVDIKAPRDGVVSEGALERGDLIQFGETIAWIED